MGGPGTIEGFWFGISPEGIGTLGMLLNFAIALVVRSFTKAPPKEVQELTDSIRYPEQDKKETTYSQFH